MAFFVDEEPDYTFTVVRHLKPVPEWCGIVDCLGHLVCKRCNAQGLGGCLEDFIFGPPRSEERCDYCADILGNMGEP